MGIDLLRAAGKRWAGALPEVAFLLIMGILLALNIKITSVYIDLRIGEWIFIGLLLGLLLSLTKWSGGWGALYAVLSGLALVIQQTGRILPSFDLPWGPYLAWSDAVRLRIALFTQRIVNWAVILLNGNPLADPYFEQMAFPLVSLLCSAWMAWWFAKRKNAMVASIPMGLFFLYYVQRWGRGPELYVVFLAATLLTIAYMAYRRRQLSWDRRGIDWPYLDSLLPEWLTGIIFITILVIFTGLAVPTLATPEGWQKIGEALKAPPREVASPVTRPESASGGYPQVTKEPRISIEVGTPSMTTIGQPPTLSQTVLFWVYISDPPPPPVEAGETSSRDRAHYWRSGIFDAYTGSGWVEASLSAEEIPGLDQNKPPGRYVLEQRFEIVSPHADTLLAMNMPFQTRDAVELVFTEDGSALVRGGAAQYTLLSWVADMTASQLNESGEAYPPDILETYLALPENIPQRVKQLADDIVLTATTPYEKALNIQSYLRSTYQYRLDVPLPPEDQDIVDYFLFDAPGGFCSYYASAMAVMLRLEGVPARVVSGFANGEFDYSRGGYRVPAAAAHAWVEVYFPGFGWVEFEPTSAYQAIIRPKDDLLDTNSQEPAAPLMKRWSAKVIVGVGFLFVAALFVFILLKLRRIAPARINSSDPVERFYWQLRKDLARVDLQRSGAYTPDEFQNYALGYLAAQSKIIRLLNAATRLYTQAMYSPRRPAKLEVEVVKAAWRAAQPEFAELWVRRLVAKTWARVKRIFVKKFDST